MSLFVMAWLAVVAASEIHQFAPTNWVITLASKPLSILDSSDWSKLQPSELSDAQVRQLAVGLLNKRQVHGEFDFPSSDAWFEAAIRDERLPPNLVDRYHHDWFVLSITVPKHVVSARSFEVGLEVTEGSMWLSGSREIYVVLGGFQMEDEDTQSRGSEVIHPLTLSEIVPPEYAVRPTASFVSQKPGETKVTVEYWLIAWAAGSGKPDAIDWNEDGSLQRPPEALYFKRFEISKTIDVQPR